MTRNLHHDSEIAESRRAFAAERADLLRAYGAHATEDKRREWDEALISIDMLTDGSHHFTGWAASRYTPTIALVTCWGGPGARWELACTWRRGGGLQLQRAAFVYMPWFGWDTHFLRQDSAAWNALVDLLDGLGYEATGDAFDAYED